MLHKFNSQNYLLSLMVIFSIIFSVFIFFTSLNVRYWADDFCHGAIYIRKGLVGGISHWWNNWSGRYSNIILLHLLLPLGEKVVRILPILLFTLFAFSLTPVISTGLGSKRFFNWKGIIIASFVVLLIFINTPNIIQTLYWMSGSTVYASPFILINLFFVFVFWSNNLKISTKKIYYFLLFFLMFVAGGFSEIFTVASLVFMVSLIFTNCTLHYKNKKQIQNILLIGSLGLIASLVAMYLAPGRAIRSSTLDKPQNLISMINSIFLGTKWYLVRLASIKSFQYSSIVLFILTWFFIPNDYVFNKKTNLPNKKLLRILSICFLAQIFTAMAVVGVSYFSMNYFPPERAMFVVVYFFFMYLIINFIVLSILIKSLSIYSLKLFQNLLLIIFTVILLLLTISTFAHWNGIKNEIKNYATKWDEQYAFLTSNRPSVVNLDYIKPVGGLDGFVENKGWVSNCAADNLGLEAIQVNQ